VRSPRRPSAEGFLGMSSRNITINSLKGLIIPHWQRTLDVSDYYLLIPLYMILTKIRKLVFIVQRKNKCHEKYIIRKREQMNR